MGAGYEDFLDIFTVLMIYKVLVLTQGIMVNRKIIKLAKEGIKMVILNSKNMFLLLIYVPKKRSAR